MGIQNLLKINDQGQENMHFLDVILQKRNGERLTQNQISHFISEYVKNNIPDYQVAALLMAIWFSKMDKQETTDLTMAMRDSGLVIDLSDIPGIKADKHSTGGVADTTTLITAPLVAACGLKVAKMSGRGLGHTGGTIDKIESIPGCKTDIDMAQFKQIVSNSGMSIIGQTQALVPADKLLYALRDVTGTIDNVSLIAASIMSKKLASGSDVVVLDVKTGNGAFMKEIEAAIQLADLMVSIGKTAGKKMVALVTDMNQPLGCAVGNALEVKEAIAVLQGNQSGDLKQVALTLAAKMILAGGLAVDDTDASNQVSQALDSGKALEKLAQMIEAQGGNPDVCTHTDRLPVADKIINVRAPKKGYIKTIQTDQVGTSALLLGAGRTKKTDRIDPAVGIWMKIRLGNAVEKGDCLAQFHVNEESHLDEAVQRFQDAITIDDQKPDKHELIYKTIP